MRLYNITEATTSRPDGFHTNIENATVKNTDYRRVLFTAEHCQLVLMSIEPGDEIGEEIHKVDQFIRVDAGNGTCVINGKEKPFRDGDAVVVPAGAKHNVINTGEEPLKLYTVYSPPQHKRTTVQKTKADDKEDRFDGKTDV
jgi:mannose-6-phosphate isomerase-like protein (cupin superfamily)